MKKSKFSESQTVAILKEGESGVRVPEVLRKNGISSATYYKWKAKYARLGVSDLATTQLVRRPDVGRVRQQSW